MCIIHKGLLFIFNTLSVNETNNLHSSHVKKRVVQNRVLPGSVRLLRSRFYPTTPLIRTIGLASLKEHTNPGSKY